MGFAIKRMPLDAFFNYEVPYVDATGLFGFLTKSAFKSNLLLIGPSGISKTLSVYAWAQEHGYPVVEYSCSEDTKAAHLKGSFGMEGDSVFFSLGALTTAIEVANEVAADPKEAADGCILLLNEVNALSPQSQKLLNPLLDFQRKINAQAVGRSFELSPEAKLWVITTMNPAAYGGTYSLNSDLMRRLMPIRLEYPTKEQEVAILRNLGAKDVDDPYVAIPDDVLKMELKFGPKTMSVVGQLVELASATRKSTSEYALSPADLHQICQNIGIYGLPQALRLAADKFENDDERAFYIAQVQSTMNIDIGNTSVLTPPSTATMIMKPRRRRR